MTRLAERSPTRARWTGLGRGRGHAKPTPADWRDLLRRARNVADPAKYLPGGVCEMAFAKSAAAALLDFQHLVRDAEVSSFPHDFSPSTAALAAGFVQVARAFALTEDPEFRALVGPALEACADALTEVLDARVRREAQARTNAIMGETDD